MAPVPSSGQKKEAFCSFKNDHQLGSGTVGQRERSSKQERNKT